MTILNSQSGRQRVQSLALGRGRLAHESQRADALSTWLQSCPWNPSSQKHCPAAHSPRSLQSEGQVRSVKLKLETTTSAYSSPEADVTPTNTRSPGDRPSIRSRLIGVVNTGRHKSSIQTVVAPIPLGPASTPSPSCENRNWCTSANDEKSNVGSEKWCASSLGSYRTRTRCGSPSLNTGMLLV